MLNAGKDLAAVLQALEISELTLEQTLVGEESLTRAYGQDEPDYSECDLQP